MIVRRTLSVLVVAATAAAVLVPSLAPPRDVRAQQGPGPTATPTPRQCSPVMDRPAVEIPCDEGCGNTDPPILPPIGDVTLPPCACPNTFTLLASWGSTCGMFQLGGPRGRSAAAASCGQVEYSGLYRRTLGSNGGFAYYLGLQPAYPGLEGGYEYRVVVADFQTNYLQLSTSCP